MYSQKTNLDTRCCESLSKQVIRNKQLLFTYWMGLISVAILISDIFSFCRVLQNFGIFLLTGNGKTGINSGIY